MSNPCRQDRRRMLLVAPLLATLALGLFAGALRLQAPRARAQSPSGDSLVLRLAERLLAGSFGTYGPYSPTTSGSVQLFPGALPAALPLDLPLPPGSTLIGSDERQSFSTPGPIYVGSSAPFVPTQTPSGIHADIVLDAGNSAEDAMAFYKNAMGSLGWSAPTGAYGYGPGGFVTSPAPLVPATYCQSSDGPWLSVTARPTAGGPVDVRLSFDSGYAGQCRAPSPPSAPPIVPPAPVGYGVLPSLDPPPNVTVRGSGGSGGLGRFSTDASAITDMSVADLDAFYANQLLAKGWTKLSSGAGGELTWSTWSVPDHSDLQGFLYVRGGPVPGQRSLHVEVASTDPNAASSQGGYGYSTGVSYATYGTSLTPISSAGNCAGIALLPGQSCSSGVVGCAQIPLGSPNPCPTPTPQPTATATPSR